MMTNLFHKKLLPSAIVGILSCAGTAMVIAADYEAFELEEIVVVARKREEKLQDVPISISSIGSSELSALGAKQLSDLSDVIPNVQIGEGTEFGITMRGISTETRTIGLEAGVGVYIDGVFVSRSATNADLAAIERVEVLRGPQGSLFGKNTIAGAVNIVTTRPSEEFAGSASVNVGNDGRRDARAYVEGAVTETANARLSVSSLKSDGYYVNDVTGNEAGGDDSIELRGDVVFNLSENLSVDLSMDYRTIDTIEVSSHLVNGPDAASSAVQDYIIGLLVADPTSVPINSFDIAHDRDYSRSVETWGGSATVEYDLPGDYSLTSITARRSSWKDQTAHDDDNLPVFLIDSQQHDRQLFSSQEFRITSLGGQKIDWLAGLYYDNQDLKSNRPVDASETLIYFLTGGAFYESATAIVDSQVETESYALYANLDYHLTDNLTLTLGGRYTEEEKSADYGLTGGCFGGVLCLYPQLDLDLNYDGSSFDPSVSLAYNIGNNVSTYLRFATGYKSGGFNVDYLQPAELAIPGLGLYTPTLTTEVPSQSPFDEEEVTSVEWGLKMTLLENRLTVNTSVFNMDYSAFQVSRFNGVSFVVDNAGEATLRGVEVDFAGQLSEHWKIVGGVGFLETEFDDYATQDSEGNATNLEGNEFPYAPEWNTNLAIEYSKNLADYGEILIRAEYTYKDEMFTSPENTDIDYVGSQEYFNGRISWFSPDESITVSLWGKNLKDTTTLIDRTLDTTIAGLIYGRLNAPLSFGLEMTYQF